MNAFEGAIPLLHDFLVQSARRLPEKAALVADGERYTYRHLDEASNALARALVRRGVERGDRVIIFADNAVETVIGFFAVLKASAVVSIVNPTTKADKLAYYLNDCRAAALITDALLAHVWTEAAGRAPHLRAILVSGKLDPARVSAPVAAAGLEEAIAAEERETPPARRAIDIDLAAIIYTSGSTGDPKGVMLTHRNMLAAATSVSSYLEMQEEDVVLCVLPVSFDYGLYQMIMSFRVGARLVLERSFSYPSRVLQRMVEEEVTGFPGVPTIFAVLVEMKNLERYDLSRIRYVSNTGAALPEKHIRMLRELLPQARVYSMYGLTECKRCTYLPPADIDRKPASVGIAIPNTEMWLVGEDGRRLGPGEVGVLVIRGATVMRGYWEKPEATAKKLIPGPLPGEQVLYTGDFCRMDEDGYLYFVGRSDDIIKSRGEKVAPKEVEAALYEVPGVKEAAVVGVPDEVLGQAIKAFVVLEQGVEMSERELIRACTARLENFMVPREVEFRDALPRTSSGKITKTGLV